MKWVVSCDTPGRQKRYCVCVFTCYRLADAVQMCDVGVGGVDLEEEVFDLTVAVVTKF